MSVRNKITLGDVLLIEVDSSPNGSVIAPKGSLAVDTIAALTYQNQNGSTLWAALGGGSAGVYAATRIVSLVPGEGTDLTIAAAIAALPAEGGRIFIKQGTFPIAATLTLPDKPIVFCGAGAESTIVDIGSNTIAAFTLGFDRSYTFEHFSIRGDGSAGQIAWRFTAASTGKETIEIRHMNVGRRVPTVAFTVEVTFDSFGAGGVPSISVEDSRFLMPSVAAARLLRGPATLDMEFSVSSAVSLVHGGISDVTAQTSLHCRSCTLTGSSWGTFSRFDQITSTFIGDSVVVVGDVCEVYGSDFIQVTTGPARWLDLLAGAHSCRVIGSYFGSYTSESIRTAAINSTVIGNENCRVAEIGIANNNRYAENLGFSGSTIVGPGSLVNGVRKTSLIGVPTTGLFVLQFVHTNPNGVTGIGTIKNIGGDSLEVREFVTDAFGVSDTRTTLVLSGNTMMLDPQTNVSTAAPPYVSYAVEVRHPGTPTTFDLRHATEGAL